MIKLLHTVGFAIAVTSALAGCDLYVGNNGSSGGDRWNYCGSDGYYSCHGDNCEWVSSTCPADGGGTGVPTGGECKQSTDCAAGCFCTNGTCEEGGFCTTDGDCGTGYHCNVARSSCEPNPTTTCTSNTDCAAGSVCDTSTGACTATCVCETDAQAVTNGFDYCDETRTTCMKGSDPVGDCVGTLTCQVTPPLCNEHEVPGIFAGCYTGQCRAISACEAAPACNSIAHKDDCFDRMADCTSVFTGINCTTTNGTACDANAAGCTCTSYQFERCEDHVTAAMVFENGADATQVIKRSLAN